MDGLPGILPPRQESARLVAGNKEGVEQVSKLDVLLMAFRAALIAMINAIEVYLDMPVSNRKSRREK